MNAMSMCWLAMGGSLCAVLVLLILLWVQWLHRQQHKTELSVLRNLLHNLGESQRLEREKAELNAGLGTKKGRSSDN